MRNRLNDVVDVIDRIRNTSVLSCALVCEVDLALSVNSYILEKCVTTDCVVDIRLALFVEVDNLSVASTFEVEHAVVVPSVLVVTDKQTFRVSRQSCLTCTRQTEEDSCVLAVLVAVSRAVH